MSSFHENLASPLREVQDQFIHEWGRMSSSWGINRTMAQIHALLIVSPNPLTVDEIMGRLLISRGNASMSLRDLIDWGLVKRFRRSGERKDSYVTEEDPWQMFVRVARERKRREIDPTAGAIRECVAHLPEGDSADSAVPRKRLSALLEVFDLLDAAYKQLISTDDVFKKAVREFRES